MGNLKVKIDEKNKHVQIYGKYRYCTELGSGNLSVVSRRKDYPEVISRGRNESSIIDAVNNYNAELEAALRSLKNSL